MSLEKATALVIRGTDWSETSRIATLFTREFGKVRALAKGGRRLKSAFEIAFDLLAVCEIAFIHKSLGGLDLLTEARLVEKFPHLRQDLHRLYCGYYVAELLAEGTADYDPHPVLFDAAVDLLRNLSKPALERPGRLLAFELAWLHELGYSPRWEDCASCGSSMPNSVSREAFVAFSPAAGGVVCAECLAEAHDRRWLSAAAWQAFRTLNQAFPHAAVLPDLRAAISQTICFRLAKRPRLLTYIEQDPAWSRSE
jgi:DNA repair protein RecO (recombination protein O)